MRKLVLTLVTITLLFAIAHAKKETKQAPTDDPMLDRCSPTYACYGGPINKCCGPSQCYDPRSTQCFHFNDGSYQVCSLTSVSCNNDFCYEPTTDSNICTAKPTTVAPTTQAPSTTTTTKSPTPTSTSADSTEYPSTTTTSSPSSNDTTTLSPSSSPTSSAPSSSPSVSPSTNAPVPSTTTTTPVPTADISGNNNAVRSNGVKNTVGTLSAFLIASIAIAIL